MIFASFDIFKKVIASALLVSCASVWAAGENSKTAPDCAVKSLEDMECSVAGLSKATVNAADLPPDVIQNCFIKPCVLPGDFDGDGKVDQAVLVANKKTGKKGVVVVFANGKKATLGAGHKLGLAGDDFSWLDSWSLVPKTASLKGDSLSLGKAVALAGVVSWHGSHFKWTQKSL